MIYREFRKLIDAKRKDRNIILFLGLIGGLLIVYPSFAVSTMFGMYGPFIVLDFLNISVSGELLALLVIPVALIIFTIINLLGVLAGKSIGRIIMTRERKAT